MKNSIKILVAVLALSSCQCSGQEKDRQLPQQSPRDQRESRMQARKDFIEREQQSIESYIADRGFDMQRSGTGLFYSIKHDTTVTDTALIKPGQRVIYSYQVYLLNGQLIYSSEESGPASLVVDRQEEIIGLHEAFQKLRLGDKGLFIIPSHLAYGVSGDQNRVPPLTALQYDIEVLKVENLNQEK